MTTTKIEVSTKTLSGLCKNQTATNQIRIMSLNSKSYSKRMDMSPENRNFLNDVILQITDPHEKMLIPRPDGSLFPDQKSRILGKLIQAKIREPQVQDFIRSCPKAPHNATAFCERFGKFCFWSGGFRVWKRAPERRKRQSILTHSK